MASNIEELRAANDTLRLKVKDTDRQNLVLEERLVMMTHSNMVLRRTVEQLKSPALI